MQQKTKTIIIIIEAYLFRRTELLKQINFLL
jgi:hypothetical protein